MESRDEYSTRTLRGSTTHVLMSNPSMTIRPEVGSMKRKKLNPKVDFPEPEMKSVSTAANNSRQPLKPTSSATDANFLLRAITGVNNPIWDEEALGHEPWGEF